MDKERKAEKYALDYLRQTIKGFDYNYIPTLYTDYTIMDKDIYRETVMIFKTLYAKSDDKLIYLALWNAYALDIDKTTKFNKDDFAEDEFNFLLTVQRYKTKNMYKLGDYNINAPLYSERLMICAPKKIHSNTYFKQIKINKKYTDYYLSDLTIKDLKYLSDLDRTCFFAVVLKESNEMIGYVGFTETPPTKCCKWNVEYYIFEEYRRMGYAKEAIGTIIDAMFRGKLYRNSKKETMYYFYKKEKLKAEIICAKSWIENEASINTVKSLGFDYEGVIHSTNYFNHHSIDSFSFYLTKKMWFENNREI